ncbi:integrase [Streptomyces poriferorum]|uniref:Integrase n=1 Tax=Streptomyces poriferorum TaxID=2798799 RepID=A0ABY9IY26_9ACTN|nr:MULTISPECIES: integrase [unclassified Streptomyces]MDP5310478.1 integrase [Streptomyces sp. Alt4]WLQ60368.1 integrase [Streptomyces sp. Alt2]
MPADFRIYLQEGAVMPWPEKRGNKWRVRWDTGRVHPDTGKKIYDSKSGFDDETTAYEYGLDRESDVRNDRYISRRDGAVLMKEYAEDWLNGIDVGHLRERACRSMARLYIVPRWGETAVGDIKPSAYRGWKKELLARPNVGADYGREILGLFAMMMDDAVEDELRKASPVSHKRRRGKYTKKVKEKKRHMDIADVHQLALNALTYWGFPGYVFVLTMACTGMRPGELYALRREYAYPNWPAADPDDERREESVERYTGVKPMPAVRVQYQHQWKDSVLTLLPPKYDSHRTLVVPQFLAELLEMLLGSHESEWVFPSINGGPLAKANFSFHYWRAIADGRDPSTPRSEGGGRGGTWRPLPGWPAVKPYAGKRLYLLRHGAKEWLDEDGHSRVAVESRMGHELAGVEGTYSNVTPAMERAIMESLQARWQGFVLTLEPGWEPVSPKPLPVDLPGWMKRQVSVAQELIP